jgi:uncharacterized FlaG/YvyC family protein
MELPPVNAVSSGITVREPNPSTDNDLPARQVVAAVHDVNKTELMGEGRQLTFARDPETRRRVIQIVDQKTGDVLDQIPPETVLRLAGQLK